MLDNQRTSQIYFPLPLTAVKSLYSKVPYLARVMTPRLNLPELPGVRKVSGSCRQGSPGERKDRAREVMKRVGSYLLRTKAIPFLH